MTSQSQLDAACRRLLADHHSDSVHFGGAVAADRLPEPGVFRAEAVAAGKDFARVVVNYSDHDEPPGTHWVMMSIDCRPRTASRLPRSQFVDSFGVALDAEDSVFSIQEGHPVRTHFYKWLMDGAVAGGLPRTKSSVVYSDLRLQSSGSDVCGEYSCYAVAHGMPSIEAKSWRRILRYTEAAARDREVADLVGIRSL